MTLPLTSPSGRYIAAQHGATPDWTVLLAQPPKPGAMALVPGTLRIDAFTTRPVAPSAPDAPGLRPIHWSTPLPSRLLLGRSCDEQGFLIESPRNDGSRWIGKVDWDSGLIDWLVRPDASQALQIAAFASLGSSGELAYSRCLAPGMPFDLVVRSVANDPSTEIVLSSASKGTEGVGVSYLFPTFSADRRHVYVFVVPPVPIAPGPGLTMLAVELPVGPTPSLNVSARIELNVEPTPAAAYQTVSSLQTPWPCASADEAGPALSAGIALFSIESGSMIWIDSRADEIIPLARGTVGAAPLILQNQAKIVCSGLLLGAAAELVFQQLAALSENAASVPLFSSEASVIAGAFIPRLTTDTSSGSRHYLLLSPPRAGDDPILGIFELVPHPTP
jgi:hypothetical protein